MNLENQKKQPYKQALLVAALVLSFISLLAAGINQNGANTVSVCWIALACFALLVGFLWLQRKKGVCFDVRAWWVQLWNRKKDGKASVLLFHRIVICATASLALLYLVLLLTSYISKASILAVCGLSALVLVLQLTYRICYDDHSSPAQLFLCVALLLGVAMAYAWPVCTWISWDDEFHFGRAYDFSTLSWLKWTESFTIHRMKVYEVSYSFTDFMKDPLAFRNQMLADANTVVPAQYRVDNPLTVIGNLPAVLTMAVLGILGADVVKIMLIGRMASVIAYALIIGSGIKRMKSGGYLFSAVCLIPCAMFLASAYSYDYWLTAWVAYSFAYFISELQQPEKKIEKQDVVCLLGSMFLACLAKQVYFFLFVPFLFLPSSKFEAPEKVKKFRRQCLLLMLVLILIFIVPIIVRPGDGSDMRGGAEVSATGQVKYILKNPMEFLKTMWKFVASYVSAPQFVQASNFYAYISSYTGGIESIWGTASLVLLLYVAFTDRGEKILLRERNRICGIGLLVSLLQIFLNATSLYVAFTPVGHDWVNGCQYRYIFPVLLPLLFFMAPASLTSSVNERTQKVIVYGGSAFLLIGTFFEAYLFHLS